MIRSFCDRNVQSVAILHKKLNIFIFIVFNFNSSFFQHIFHCNIPLGHDFPTILNLLNYFKYSKKIDAMNKKSYFKCLIMGLVIKRMVSSKEGLF